MIKFLCSNESDPDEYGNTKDTLDGSAVNGDIDNPVQVTDIAQVSRRNCIVCES